MSEDFSSRSVSDLPGKCVVLTVQSLFLFSVVWLRQLFRLCVGGFAGRLRLLIMRRRILMQLAVVSAVFRRVLMCFASSSCAAACRNLFVVILRCDQDPCCKSSGCLLLFSRQRDVCALHFRTLTRLVKFVAWGLISVGDGRRLSCCGAVRP